MTVGAQLVPNELNEFFIKSAEILLSNLPSTINDPISYMFQTQTCKVFKFEEVSENVVRDSITDLNSSNAKDIFGLNTELIKSAKNLITPPLTKLINKSIHRNIFPDCLKTAKCIPCYKKGDPNDKNNYRPISILPIFSKILEKILVKQLTKHFEENSLLNKSQYGFGSGRSTTQAILDFTNKCLNSFEKGEYALGTFLDLSKAFDSLSHVILLQKLSHYNVDPFSCSLLSSYLSNRKQFVRVNGKSSEEMLITHGVPQGSILGPLLFIIYINDLAPYINGVISLRAQTNLSKSASDSEITEKEMEHTIPKGEGTEDSIESEDIPPLGDEERRDSQPEEPSDDNEKEESLPSTPTTLVMPTPANNTKKEADIVLYADDTTILNTGITIDEVLEKNERILQKAYPWFSDNRLTLNDMKTVKLIFTLRENIPEMIGKTATFLGVKLDAKLNWHSHGDCMAEKLNKIIFLLRNLASSVTPCMLRTTYFAVFQSCVSYGILAWGHSAITHRMFKLQRRAVRIVGKLKYREDCRNIFKALKILTIPCLFILECVMYVKVNANFFVLHEDNHQYNTRHKKDLAQMANRLNRSENSVRFYCIKFYNKLPTTIKNLEKNSFKHAVTLILLTNVFYNFDEFLSYSF